ncbi:MAG: hypothetical protein ACRDRU_15105 [Pseudonocardiaceae bacterium]
MLNMAVGGPARVFGWLDEAAQRMGRAGLVRRIYHVQLEELVEYWARRKAS